MIQGSGIRVLACFLNQDTLSFTQICKDAGYPTDLGGYYIRQLVRGGYVAKGERGQYTILPKGKQELGLYYREHRVTSRPRLIALVVATQGNQYVVLRRARQPFISKAEWMAGAVEGEERLTDAARRILQYRVGVSDVEPHLCGFYRRIDLFKDSLFDDKLFAVHTCTLPKGEKLSADPKWGSLEFYTAKSLPAIEQPSRALLDILKYVQQGDGGYEEHTYQLDETDLS
jgi:predicted transcriptional regulator